MLRYTVAPVFLQLLCHFSFAPSPLLSPGCQCVPRVPHCPLPLGPWALCCLLCCISSSGSQRLPEAFETLAPLTSIPNPVFQGLGGQGIGAMPSPLLTLPPMLVSSQVSSGACAQNTSFFPLQLPACLPIWQPVQIDNREINSSLGQS